jgi:hypothetical protein
MTKMNKFLALLPVVAFAVGCSGVAPGGPNAVANDANELVSGGVSAMGRNCKGLESIDLAVDTSDDSMVWVKATYVFSNPLGTPCPAPTWSSDRDGLTVDPSNLFRAGFFRMAGGRASLQATGPNGVHNVIDFSLGGDNRLVPITCDDVTGMQLNFVPSNDDTQILVLARYEYDVPEPVICTEPPTFTLNRRGLTVDATNPFLARIDMDSGTRSELIAAGPNALTASIGF